ncbi:MAG: hypothetical protein HYU37_16380 [Acidobacteria bacterium]|nr:hypothetical protein [Acidobacteriota bacterium]
MSENRFARMSEYLKYAAAPGALHARSRGMARTGPAATVPGYASAQSRGWVRPMAAQDRLLVVLIENGGIDLGVQKLVKHIPGIDVLSDAQRRELETFIEDKIRSVTDKLLEDAELSINRYSAAKPDLFGDVIVLRDGTASYDDLKRTLIAQSRQGKIIDLVILTHGGKDSISVRGGITGQKIRNIRTELGQPLNIRSVYMMNCQASTLNKAWIDAGARVSAGSRENNYLPEPTTFFFWKNWKEGQSFERAVTGAYIATVNLMNDTIRGLVGAIPIVGSKLAGSIDVGKLDFVRQSEPVIQGQRSLTITSDNLTAAQSTPSSLVTTVVPSDVLGAPAPSVAASLSGAAVVSSYKFHSPSWVVAEQATYSLAQNPAAAVAAIGLADAAQIGLGAAAIVQAQVSASQGAFTLSYDKAQRLLTTEARVQMKGAQVAKQPYSRPLFYIGGIRVGTAEATVIVEWEGNPYGEIGTAIIRRDLANSTEWSKSSCNLTITKADRIPLPNTDPRAWPIVYVYEGSYDPLGNGHFEFNGEFEINAFGGLKFNKHQVFSRSLLDVAIMGTPDSYVQKGPDNIVPVPPIPEEQMKYLKTRLP